MANGGCCSTDFAIRRLTLVPDLTRVFEVFGRSDTLFQGE